MQGVGLRSERAFDQDTSERAKRNLNKDMQVDDTADRPAIEKPVETTPQVAKKTRTYEEKKEGEEPQNIPISTPKGRSEKPKASSEPRSTQRPRRGRSRQRSEERRRSPPISASVAVEATEAARSAAPSEGWYGKQQNILANQ